MNVWAATLLVVANMKKTSKVALCGILAALQIVVMLVAYFPYLTFALPAIAGCLAIPVVIEVGKKYAVATYVSVAVLSFMLCEKEASTYYIFLFGYYPVLKAVIEKAKSKVLQWIAKTSTSCVSFVLAYYLSSFVLQIELETLGDFGKFSVLILLLLFVAMFVVYDFAVSNVVRLYIVRFRKLVKKIFN